MVARAYAAKRQELAKKIGLGRKPRTPEPAPAPVKTGAARSRPDKATRNAGYPVNAARNSLLVLIQIPCSAIAPQNA